VKDRDLRALEERLESLAERLSSIEEGGARAGAGDVVAAVRDLAQGMRRQDRVLSLNSFVAYLLFTVLLCAMFFFLFRGRADDVAAERDRAAAARDAAQARADASARQLAARDAADRASAEVLELLRRRRYQEAIAAHRTLEGLSPAQRQFLADAVDGARAELTAEAAVRARQAFDRRDYENAREAAAGGLALTSEGATAAELRYLLGASLDKLGRAAEAQTAFAAFVAAAPDHPMATRVRQRLRRLEQSAPLTVGN
jgi:tetratricopeptide (TPR) repeat protein